MSFAQHARGNLDGRATPLQRRTLAKELTVVFLFKVLILTALYFAFFDSPPSAIDMSAPFRLSPDRVGENSNG